MKKTINVDDLLTDVKIRNNVYDELYKGNEPEKLFKEYALINGTKFEMILPGYMTWKQYAALYGLKDDTARWYTKESVCTIFDELVDDGIKKYSTTEFEQLKQNLIGNTITNYQLYANATIYKTGEWLFPLKAVHKIGSTIKSSSYRDFTFEKMNQGIVLEEVVKEQNEKTLTFILELADQGEVVSTDKLFDVIEAMSKTTALNTLTGINKAIEDINAIKIRYEKVKDELKTQLENGTVVPGNKLRVKAKIENIGTLIYNLAEIKDEYKDIKDKYKDKLFARVKTIADKNLTDIICERDDECKKLQKLGKPGRIKLNALIKEYKDALVEAGVLYMEEYTKNEGKVDESGKDLSKKAYNYLPTKKYEWIGESTVGCFSRTHAAQTIKLSEYGAMCFNYMFDMIESEDGFKDFEEEDFKDHIVSTN